LVNNVDELGLVYELNPICHKLTLLGPPYIYIYIYIYIYDISRLRVKG